MFDGRVALVTGGARGIGAAISSQLAERGAHVAVGYSSSRETAEEFAREVTERGGSISVHQGNIGVPEDCERVVREVLTGHGRVDFLVNNAGITLDKTVRRMTVEDWHAVLRVNLSGAFYMSKAILDHMLERGSGRIVNIGSVIGEQGNIGQANYAASKSGLFGLTKSMALETAAKGLTINCVAPGFIDTDMVADVPESVLETIKQRIPMRRLGQAGEIGHAVCFLLEDDASYITGSVLAVNGGMEM